MAKAKLSKKQIIGIVIAAVIVVLLAAGGVYCVATDQNPVDAAVSVFSSSEDKLIGKWQSETSPGLSAYVFNDDGTYDSYLSTVNFSGKYTVKGNKITLINPDTNKEIVYKFKISGKNLTLTLIEDGKESDESVYNSVDELNQKSLSDIIGEVVEGNETTQAEDTTAE